MNIAVDFNYPRMVRGCVRRPDVKLIPGVRESFRIQMLLEEDKMNMTIDELKNYPMPRVIPLPKWSKAAENSVICLDGSWKVTDKKRWCSTTGSGAL